MKLGRIARLAGMAGLVALASGACTKSMIRKTMEVQIPSGYTVRYSTAAKLAILAGIYDGKIYPKIERNSCVVDNDTLDQLNDNTVISPETVDMLAKRADENGDKYVDYGEIQRIGDEICHNYRAGKNNRRE